MPCIKPTLLQFRLGVSSHDAFQKQPIFILDRTLFWREWAGSREGLGRGVGRGWAGGREGLGWERKGWAGGRSEEVGGT